SMSVRLMIASSTRTGTVEEGLAATAHRIFAGLIATANDLKADLLSLTPADVRFAAAFEIATLSNRKLARYYLRSMELAAKDESEPWHIPNDDRSVINLEHVLPEKPEGNWTAFTEEQVKLYYKRIGNLCLMRASDNSASKSDGFLAKKPIFANSPYVLTKQVAEAADWTATEIGERQKTLAAIAVKTWSI
ncbi:MAG: HNH endonuclease family protein, partial [Methylovirgula sp.]